MKTSSGKMIFFLIVMLVLGSGVVWGDAGDILWRFDSRLTDLSSPALDSYGTIYFSSIDDYVFAVNPDGTEKWRVQIPIVKRAHHLTVPAVNEIRSYGLIGSNVLKDNYNCRPSCTRLL